MGIYVKRLRGPSSRSSYAKHLAKLQKPSKDVDTTLGYIDRYDRLRTTAPAVAKTIANSR
jgi:hypothetical protein